MDQSDRRYLREQLPLLDLNRPFLMSACAPNLKAFFDQYGFTLLLKEQPCFYTMGQIRLGGFGCVAHCWEPSENQRENSQTVVIGHGLFDHTGLFLKLVQSLLAAGFTVFMPDFPGHGLSEGNLASIDCFDQYANVIADTVLLLERWPERFGNISLVGQSTGGAAILWYLLDQVHTSSIHRVVLLAPLLRPTWFKWIRTVFPLLQLLGVTPKRHFKANSNDAEFCHFLENEDPLQAQIIPRPWISAMLEWVYWFERQSRIVSTPKAPLLDVPALIIQGDNDSVVDWRYNLPKITGVFQNADTMMVEGAQHHLVNESAKYRQRMFDAIIKFLY